MTKTHHTCNRCSVPLTKENGVSTWRERSYYMCKPCVAAISRVKYNFVGPPIPPKPRACRVCDTSLHEDNWRKIRGNICIPCFIVDRKEQARRRFARRPRRKCAECKTEIERKSKAVRCPSCALIRGRKFKRENRIQRTPEQVKRDNLRRNKNRKKPPALVYGRHLHSDTYGRVCKTCKQYQTWNSFTLKGSGFYRDGTPKRETICKQCTKKNITTASGLFKWFKWKADKRARGQTPVWRDNKKIASLLQQRQAWRNTTGLEYHIDHIVPLRGTIGGVRLVSGLHWEGNLQILTASANMKKGGHEWPDMPNYSPQDLQELTA